MHPHGSTELGASLISLSMVHFRGLLRFSEMKWLHRDSDDPDNLRLSNNLACRHVAHESDDQKELVWRLLEKGLAYFL